MSGTIRALLHKNDGGDWTPVTDDDFSASDFNNLINKPTTLSGYGITDAVESSEVVEGFSPNKIVRFPAAGPLTLEDGYFVIDNSSGIIGQAGLQVITNYTGHTASFSNYNTNQTVLDLRFNNGSGGNFIEGSDDMDVNYKKFTIERSQGNYVWHYNSYTGTLARPATLTANRTWTLPSSSGYLALTSQANGSILTNDISDATADSSLNPGKILKSNDSGFLTLERLTTTTIFTDFISVGSIHFISEFTFEIVQPVLTEDRSCQLPDGSGIFALTSQLNGSIASSDITDATASLAVNKLVKRDASGNADFNFINVGNAGVTNGKITFKNVSGGVITISSHGLNNSRTLNLPTGTSTKTLALTSSANGEIVSSDVSDSTNNAIFNPQKLLKSDISGGISLSSLYCLGTLTCASVVSALGLEAQTLSATLNIDLGNGVNGAVLDYSNISGYKTHKFPNASGNLALVAATNGQIVSNDVSDATSNANSNPSKVLKSDGAGAISLSDLTVQNYITCAAITSPTVFAQEVLVENSVNNETCLLSPANITAERTLTLPDSTGTLPVIKTRAVTGDPAAESNVILINTFDNNIKIYADGGWRTIASW